MPGCPTGCSCDWAPRSDTDRVTEMLRLLHLSAGYVDQAPGRSGISGLDHALRTAAMGRAHGLHEDSAFIGLVHDLGRPLNDVHHGELVAEMVRDRVSVLAYYVLRTHGEYQAAIVHRTSAPQHGRIQRVAMQLAGFELRSFATDYDGPQMTVPEAEQLIRDYLG